LTASGIFSAAKMELEAASMFAPASLALSEVAGFIPPSTSILRSGNFSLSVRIFDSTSAMYF
jgi:hypothetical protein